MNAERETVASFTRHVPCRSLPAHLNRVVALAPEQELDGILDNLSTHTPKHDRWLARHPRVQWHDTPTLASWLTLIEVSYSVLTRAALAGASFFSVRARRDAIDR